MSDSATKEVFVSRKVDDISQIVLTDSQQEALEKVKSTVMSEGVASLTGYAGTGKTTLMKRLIRDLEDKVNGIYLMAPTHKAANILSRVTGRKVRTIHSTFGLKPVWDGKGGYKFVPHKGGNKEKFVPRSLVIVDEASMVTSQLYELLMEAANKNHLYILFVGDGAQLPPVNEKPSPALSHEGYQLVEVIRQAGENPIVPLSMDVRAKGIKADFAGKYDGAFNVNGEGVLAYKDIGEWLEKAIYLFSTDEYQSNSEHARVIAYRNATVDEYNSIIREVIHNTEEDYIEGEWIYAKEPWYDPEHDDWQPPVIQNSEEVVIKGIEPNSTFGFKTWILEIAPSPDADPEDHRFIEVIQHSERPKYEAKLNQILKKAKGGKRWMWKKYYDLKEMFANVDYAYAITAHKSQGSTFDHVFMDIDDMSVCRGHEERKSLIYVGVTRPAKTLNVLIQK